MPAQPIDTIEDAGWQVVEDRFDPARETAFSSYAVPTMLGELKRYFRDNGWAVHVPRGMQERVMQVDNAVKDISRRLGRSPSVAEIGAQLELTQEQVLEAMEAASAYDAISLEEQRGSEQRDSQEPTYADSLGSEEERYELVSMDSFGPGQIWYAGREPSVPGQIELYGTGVEAGGGPEPTGRRRDPRFEFEVRASGSVARTYTTYPGSDEFLFVEQVFTRP